MKNYVEERDGGYYIDGTRISLDGIIHLFNEGASPEAILRSFPMAGSLENVYGAITFYLANREAVETFLSEQRRLDEEAGKKQAPIPESLERKLKQTREALPR